MRMKGLIFIIALLCLAHAWAQRDDFDESPKSLEKRTRYLTLVGQNRRFISYSARRPSKKLAHTPIVSIELCADGEC
ncbi:unnamed protein product, partial [Mesorhabditis belari]|uniref:Secreted protein n=1 Tax=Mesorhabditis belari TaxID=2138241 RepID=A0AAF3FEC4_9BILA